MGTLKTNVIPNFGHIIRKETVEYARAGKMNGKRGRRRMKTMDLNGNMATRRTSNCHNSESKGLDRMEKVSVKKELRFTRKYILTRFKATDGEKKKFSHIVSKIP